VYNNNIDIIFILVNILYWYDSDISLYKNLIDISILENTKIHLNLNRYLKDIIKMYLYGITMRGEDVINLFYNFILIYIESGVNHIFINNIKYIYEELLTDLEYNKIIDKLKRQYAHIKTSKGTYNNNVIKYCDGNLAWWGQ
jgi:hypothetical protein